VILVDTSIWVGHLKVGHPVLESLLDRVSVLGHPWVTGELALGHLSQRAQVLHLLTRLPQAEVATPAEVLDFIEHRQLHGLGIGYVDAQLLAATQLTPDAQLWTAGRRLAAAASRLNLSADPAAL
jgi:predicted nucleic acid-binding protein